MDGHNTVASFHSVVAWIECIWLHGRLGAVKAFIPDHIASQYHWFISFRRCLDRMQSCTSSTNLTICPILVPTAPLVQMLPTKGRFAWVFLSHLLIAGCDIGVQISVRPSVRSFVRSFVRPSVRPSTFTSKFGFLYVSDS